MARAPGSLPPSHALADFQAAARPDRLMIVRVALRDGFALGYGKADICRVLRALTAADFYKTMPGIQDPLIMHDVYHITDPTTGRQLYIKFVFQSGAWRLLSFKER
jgi:hypothetical protein